MRPDGNERTQDVRVPTRAFKQAVQNVRRLIPKRPELPVCSGALLRASDGQLTVTGGSPETGSLTLELECAGGDVPDVLTSARLLGDLVAKHDPGGQTTLRSSGSHLIVEQGEHHARLLTLPTEDYPRPPAPPACGHRIAADHLVRVSKDVAAAAATSENTAGRAALTCVKLEASAHRFRALASDGYRLTVLDTATTPVGEVDQGSTSSVLIPAVVFQRIAPPIARSAKHAILAMSGAGVQLATPDSSAHVPAAEIGGFPDLDQSMEANRTTRVHVERDALQRELKLLTVAARRDDLIHLRIDGARLHLEAGTEGTHETRGESSIAIIEAPAVETHDIAFSHRLLTRLLTGHPHGPIELAFSNDLKPAEITCPSRPGVRNLLMPIRTSS